MSPTMRAMSASVTSSPPLQKAALLFARISAMRASSAANASLRWARSVAARDADSPVLERPITEMTPSSGKNVDRRKMPTSPATISGARMEAVAIPAANAVAPCSTTAASPCATPARTNSPEHTIGVTSDRFGGGGIVSDISPSQHARGAMSSEDCGWLLPGPLLLGEISTVARGAGTRLGSAHVGPARCRCPGGSRRPTWSGGGRSGARDMSGEGWRLRASTVARSGVAGWSRRARAVVPSTDDGVLGRYAGAGSTADGDGVLALGTALPHVGDLALTRDGATLLALTGSVGRVYGIDSEGKLDTEEPFAKTGQLAASFILLDVGRSGSRPGCGAIRWSWGPSLTS